MSKNVNVLLNFIACNSRENKNFKDAYLGNCVIKPIKNDVDKCR